MLNGRLRDIEVTVKDGFARGLGKQEEGGGEFGNWKRLLQLLRDPYLERAKLVEGIFTIKEDEIEDGTQKKKKDISELIWREARQGMLLIA